MIATVLCKWCLLLPSLLFLFPRPVWFPSLALHKAPLHRSVTKLDTRPLCWGSSWTKALPTPRLLKEFFPTQVCAANNETEFGAGKTGFYSVTRELRRGVHALKVRSPRRKGSKGILRVRRQTGHQGSRKGVETSGAAGAYTVSHAPLHTAPVVPSRVQIPLFPPGRDEAWWWSKGNSWTSPGFISTGEILWSSQGQFRVVDHCVSLKAHISLSKTSKHLPNTRCFWNRDESRPGSSSQGLVWKHRDKSRHGKWWHLSYFICHLGAGWFSLVLLQDFVASCW